MSDLTIVAGGNYVHKADYHKYLETMLIPELAFHTTSVSDELVAGFRFCLNSNQKIPFRIKRSNFESDYIEVDWY